MLCNTYLRHNIILSSIYLVILYTLTNLSFHICNLFNIHYNIRIGKYFYYIFYHAFRIVGNLKFKSERLNVYVVILILLYKNIRFKLISLRIVYCKIYTRILALSDKYIYSIIIIFM